MIARGRCIRDDESNKITGFVCTLTDGQDLIDAQQKAVQTQQYVSTVLKASAITLIVVDKKRKVTMFEGYTEALDKLGVTGEGAMGRLLEDAWPDLECAEQAQAMLAQQDEVVS
jgi:transcriptional regulator with PAS, ATPase and Fis domain